MSADKEGNIVDGSGGRRDSQIRTDGNTRGAAGAAAEEHDISI